MQTNAKSFSKENPFKTHNFDKHRGGGFFKKKLARGFLDNFSKLCFF